MAGLTGGDLDLVRAGALNKGFFGKLRRRRGVVVAAVLIDGGSGRLSGWAELILRRTLSPVLWQLLFWQDGVGRGGGDARLSPAATPKDISRGRRRGIVTPGADVAVAACCCCLALVTSRSGASSISSTWSLVSCASARSRLRAALPLPDENAMYAGNA